LAHEVGDDEAESRRFSSSTAGGGAVKPCSAASVQRHAKKVVTPQAQTQRAIPDAMKRVGIRISRAIPAQRRVNSAAQPRAKTSVDSVKVRKSRIGVSVIVACARMKLYKRWGPRMEVLVRVVS
jgi:hypothetical protein